MFEELIAQMIVTSPTVGIIALAWFREAKRSDRLETYILRRFGGSDDVLLDVIKE